MGRTNSDEIASVETRVENSGFCMAVVHCIESARKIAHKPEFA
jgi:hypothetical protein